MPDTIKERDLTFGERLGVLREEMGLTIDELVFKSNVPYSALRRWEKDGSSPTVSQCLPRLADALGVSVEYLLFGIGEKTSKV